MPLLEDEDGEFFDSFSKEFRYTLNIIIHTYTLSSMPNTYTYYILW